MASQSAVLKVYDLLEKAGRPLLAREINEAISDVPNSTISASITWLMKRQTKRIKKIPIDGKRSYLYALEEWVPSAPMVIPDGRKTQIQENKHLDEDPAPVKKVLETVDETSLSAAIHVVGRQMADLIIESLIANLRQTMEPRIAEMVQNLIPAPVPKEKSKLRKVAIIGLEPAQKQIIINEFSKEFTLYFDSGKDFVKIKSFGSNCEAVFLHIDHMSHSVESALKSVHANIIRVPGGMTSMRDALTQYYCG
jgi:hypothetical protein